MNDQEFEAQLRRLRPAPPSNDLMVRLQQARPVASDRPAAWWRRLALPLAAAACALALLLVSLPRTRPAADPAPARVAAALPAPAYEPVEAHDYILGTQPVGIGHAGNGQPYRAVRCYGVRREVWRKTADGSEVAVVVPQQQVILAKMDVY